jgi:PadR family transcriptional regulator PadR
MYIDNWQTQLRKGMLDIVILNFLAHDPCHGYEIVQQLKKAKGLKLREGSIYSILSRLEQESFIESYTQDGSDGPPRKCFNITPTGADMLKQMNIHWEKMISSIQQVRKGDGAIY